MVELVPVSLNVDKMDFLKELFFLDYSVIVQVIDIDMNLNHEALDVVPIHLFSDSDMRVLKLMLLKDLAPLSQQFLHLKIHFLVEIDCIFFLEMKYLQSMMITHYQNPFQNLIIWKWTLR